MANASCEAGPIVAPVEGRLFCVLAICPVRRAHPHRIVNSHLAASTIPPQSSGRPMLLARTPEGEAPAATSDAPEPARPGAPLACPSATREKTAYEFRMLSVALPVDAVSIEYKVATPITVAAWAVMLFCCCAVVALCAALASACAVAW